MKTLKIIRKWETCSSIEVVKNKTARFSFAESSQLLKTEDRSSSDYISGYNDFEASFLNGADHALAGPPMRRFSRVVLYDYGGGGGVNWFRQAGSSLPQFRIPLGQYLSNSASSPPLP